MLIYSNSTVFAKETREMWNKVMGACRLNFRIHLLF
jgi:hypothetical protein